MKVKKISMKLLVILGLLFGSFVFWNTNFPSGTWLYKVTVEIETPEGVKSGSAVRQLSLGTPSIDFPDVGNPASIKGEAVVVDLGKRGIVFALLSDQSWQNGLYQAFPTKGPSSNKGILHYKKTLKPGMKGTWEEWRPRFVMFKDIKDPKSVTMVYSQSYSREAKAYLAEDHFTELLGEGVELKQIIVEITNEPVTWAIEKILPWLPEVLMSNIDGTSVSMKNDLSNTLHGGHFKKG